MCGRDEQDELDAHVAVMMVQIMIMIQMVMMVMMMCIMTMTMTMTMAMTMTMMINMIVIMIGCWSFTSPLDQSPSKGFPSHQGICTSSATSLTQCPNLTHTECPSHTVSQPLTGGGK